MARVTDEKLGHSDESDGIEEYDNPLPDWWVGLFVISVIFAGVYPIWFHGTEGHTQVAAYELEMAAAEKRWPKTDAIAKLAMDAATLAEGEKLFIQTCASCHKADLTGQIGPNLIDDEWIHGGTDADILNTITNGISTKGMPAWGGILGPKKVAQIASFVVSKRGSTPAKTASPKDAALSEEPTELDGEALFKANCAACHKADLTGLIGPNLIDDEWIHGGELDQIKATITDGVPAKGMIAWGAILGEAKIEALAQYVHSKSHSDD